MSLYFLTVKTHDDVVLVVHLGTKYLIAVMLQFIIREFEYHLLINVDMEIDITAKGLVNKV